MAKKSKQVYSAVMEYSPKETPIRNVVQAIFNIPATELQAQMNLYCTGNRSESYALAQKLDRNSQQCYL